MKFLKSGWFKFIIFLIVFIIIAMLFYFKKEEPPVYRTTFVTSGDIDSFIEGSGVIRASDSRKIYSKVSAEVLEVLHDEGDMVSKDEVIASLDSSAYDTTVESQKIAINQANLSINNIKKQINDLTIVANASGYISGLSINEGSYVTNTMAVCDIIEQGAYEIVLPFTYSANNMPQVGNTVKMTLMGNYATLDGIITKVSDMRKLAAASSQVVDVTIKVVTTGYSLDGAEAKGELLVNGTRQGSTANGHFKSVNLNTVRAKSMGNVEKLYVYEGKYVSAGEVIAKLSNDDLNTSLQNANLSLQSLKSQYNLALDQLGYYTIKAPIDGKITMQNLSVGDMVGTGTVVSTISNDDTFEFDIPVDELDIAKIAYDNEVRVSIDAIAETSTTPIIGRISKLPLEGISTSGVTEYYVTIELPGREDIRISMSANAKIITNSLKDVLVLPIDAIKKEDGVNKVDVLLDDGTVEEREIEVGSRNISYAEVKSGLSLGEEVIIPESKSIFGF